MARVVVRVEWSIPATSFEKFLVKEGHWRIIIFGRAPDGQMTNKASKVLPFTPTTTTTSDDTIQRRYVYSVEFELNVPADQTFPALEVTIRFDEEGLIRSPVGDVVGYAAKPEIESPQATEFSAVMGWLSGSGKPPIELTEEVASETVGDNRRLGVDAFLDGKLLEHALVANRKTVVEVSIGPEGTAKKQLTEPINLEFGGRDLMSLPVRFVHEGGYAQQMMMVRRDPTTRAAVTFEVMPVGVHFNAIIVVYGEDGSTVIESALLSAALVATEEDQQLSPETIKLVRVPVAGLTAPSADAVGSIVTDGDQAVISTPEIPIRVTPEAAVAGVARVINTLQTAARNYIATHGTFDITKALVAVAQEGYRLRSRLDLDTLRDLDRIQVISFYAQSTFPLELVFDGEPPVDEATQCDGWQQALETGNCPSCGDATDTSRICPLRFWGLTKVIEHHVGNTTGNVPFAARQHILAEAEPIAVPSSTVIGASAKVIEVLAGVASTGTNREALLADVVTEANNLGMYYVVDDWEDWRTVIDKFNPNLLVAMPHQDTEGSVPALELGGELEATFVEGHVRKAGVTPGPIVLLLGCDTSTAPDLIGSFASDMRRYAPVVVATIGKVVAEEAPFVASIVIDRLEHAMRQSGATIGTALLEARRALLAKSRVVSLLLVGHGDARWEVKES